MEHIDVLERFIETLRRYDEGDTPERVLPPRDAPAEPAAASLPPCFQAWLMLSPYEHARVAGVQLAGSRAALVQIAEQHAGYLPPDMVPFGWCEDLGADLCFQQTGTPLSDDAEVIGIDHEDGRRTRLGAFPDLLAGWIDQMEYLLEEQKRFL